MSLWHLGEGRCDIGLCQQTQQRRQKRQVLLSHTPQTNAPEPCSELSATGRVPLCPPGTLAQPRATWLTRVPEGDSPVFPPSITCACSLISPLFSQLVCASAGIKGQLQILTIPPRRAGVPVPPPREPGGPRDRNEAEAMDNDGDRTAQGHVPLPASLGTCSASPELSHRSFPWLS